MPSRLNLPIVLFSVAIDLSPCNTCTSTEGWLSEAVVKVSLLEVGMVVFLCINGVVTPPRVSMPNVKGVTSKSNISCTSP